MTREEQDKRWAEHSKEVQQDIIERHNSYDTSVPVLKALKESLEYTYGSHNLQPKLTYDDVARELFEDGYYYYDYVYDRIVTNSVKPTMPMACTSQNQVRKLCAINQLLNIAKFLNFNDDGTDWVPDWDNMTPDEKVWSLGIDENTIHVYYIQKYDGTRPEIVYFRTESLAK